MSSDTRGATRASRKKKKKVSRARTWVKRILFTLLSLFALMCVAIAIAYATIDPPKPNQLANAQASIIYYADGKTEMARISDVNGNRESIELKAIPDHVQKAVIAAEDRTFYTNNGVSPSGIARAIWEAARGSDSQSGGSTITQQYVKNYFLTQDKSLTRKGKEIIIAVKIDQQQSKEEILQNYLNTIYYGRGAYGIKTASRAYFGKDPAQLSVAEGAVLASVMNAPSLYDPALGTKQKENLKNRMSYVLDGMVTEGWLAPDARAKITAVPKTIAPQPNKALSGPNGYIVDAVRRELAASLKLSDNDIDRGGLRITTTIDKKAQDAAVAAVAKDLPADAKDVYAGLAAIRPGDGAIVAMYGGADYQKRQFNSATQAQMQAGSTFKPFALIAALQQGVSTKTRFDGNSPYRVPNSDITVPNEFDEDFGRVDLRKATAKSINTVFMRLNEQIGPKATKDAAVAAGIPAATKDLNDVLVNVLGVSAPRVIDVANAYGTIAANGVRAKPYLLAAVTGEEVDINYKAPKQVAQAFSPEVAADTLDAMKAATEPGGTASKAQNLGRPVVGKTGTTDGHKSVWFTGMVPQLSVSVGMYKDVNGVQEELKNIGGIDELSGNSIPLSIWLDFMSAALDGVPPADFPQRAGIGDDKVYVPPPPVTTTQPPSTTTTTPPTTPPPTTTTPPPSTTTTTRAKPPATTPPSTTTTTKPTIALPTIGAGQSTTTAPGG